MSDAEVQDEHGRSVEAAIRPGSDGEHALQQRLGTSQRAGRFYDEQVLDHLNERMRDFTLRQEMFFLATADRHGECDNSFRAGPPGFLQVLDEKTLLFPEYRGNGVHASLGNIQENPHVGLLLIDFLRARIGLHVNGRAEICEDADLRALHPQLPQDPVPGRRALLWVKVSVEEAYIHCAKHIPHLQRAPKGAARDWGTDDYKRKGGDFFGAARDARRRGPVERPAREHAAPAAEGTGALVAEPGVAEPGVAEPVPGLPAPPSASAPAHASDPATPAYGLPVQVPSQASGAQQLPPQAPPPPAGPPVAAPSLPGAPPPSVPPQAGRERAPQEPPDTGAANDAAAGVSGVMAARGGMPTGEEAEAWRLEAERALAEAERRAANADASPPFQGWFG